MTIPRITTPTTSRKAFLSGFLAGILLFCLLLVSGYGTRIWGTGTVVDHVLYDPRDTLWLFLGSIITAGTPVILVLRFSILAPVILLTGLFLIGVGFAGPGVIFTVFFWPLFLAVLLALGGAEYALKRRVAS